MPINSNILPKGLMVSCQAYEGDPLFGAHFMARMAIAAKMGGAVGIRGNSPPDISAIRQATDLPIIGIYKINIPGYDVYITPDFEAARSIAEAGSDVIAIDATPRPRPGGILLADLIDYIHDVLGKPVLADASCVEDALLAESLHADMISTTLSGYTAHGRPACEGPDLELVQQLVIQVHIPVIAEGRFFKPAQAAQAMQFGAHAVVVGGAITRPEKITERFVNAIAKAVPGAS